MYKVEYHKRVIKFLSKQNLDFRKKVLDSFDEIALTPHQNNFDIKPMQGEKDNYRLRLGKYRIIFEIKDEQLLIKVIDAGSCGDIYK